MGLFIGLSSYSIVSYVRVVITAAVIVVNGFLRIVIVNPEVASNIRVERRVSLHAISFDKERLPAECGCAVGVINMQYTVHVRINTRQLCCFVKMARWLYRCVRVKPKTNKVKWIAWWGAELSRDVTDRSHELNEP